MNLSEKLRGRGSKPEPRSSVGTLSSKLLGDKIPHGSSRVAAALRVAGVSKSPEFHRVQQLPRRILSFSAEQHARLEKYFIKNPSECSGCNFCGGKTSLREIQGQALIEAALADGLFGAIGVGFGKTLVSLLIPEMLHTKKTVLLVPPQVRDQLLVYDIPQLSKHFNLPLKVITVVAYSELSSVRKADILDKIKPDLIIADEAHRLRRKESSRTRRFNRYMKNNSATRFVALSGTMTTRSIHDYAHLIECALRKNSPLPNGYRELSDWADAIDVLPDDQVKPPGALLLFCNENEPVRSGFRRRLVETPGVVATVESAIGTSLIIRSRPLVIPDIVKDALETLESNWAVGNEELEDAMAKAKYARQIALGFYYRWAWPDGEPDLEWLEARANWHREMRQRLLHTSVEGMDSPLLLAQAAASGRWKSETWAVWALVKGREAPPTEAVWLDDFAVRDAIAWAREVVQEEESPGGIIWYLHRAVGEAIAKAGNFPLFGDGERASLDILSARPETQPIIVVSANAHREAKNIQAYARSLMTSPHASGSAWEQNLGRQHRPGQLADEVFFDSYLHTDATRSAFESALKDARYQEETFGQKQKLNYATRIGC